jgi:hypothetical protein
MEFYDICIIKHPLSKKLKKLSDKYKVIAKQKTSYCIPATVFLGRMH